MDRSIFVVWNPKAGSAEQQAELRAELENRPGVTVGDASSPTEIQESVRKARNRGAETLVAAGGDGTVNAVVNALGEPPSNVRLGVLPLGTANDLCHTLAVPEDPFEAVRLLNSPNVRRLDLVRMETATKHFYYINMATGGNSGEILEFVTDEIKQRWGSLAYVRGAAEILKQFTLYNTTLRLDDGPEEYFPMFNIILGNGRTSAGGFQIAPLANPEDGLLEVVLVLDGSLVDLANLAAQLLRGNYLENEHIVYRQAGRVSVEAQPPLPFSADGEAVTKEPVRFTVVPQAVQVIVGPDYTAEPSPLEQE